MISAEEKNWVVSDGVSGLPYACGGPTCQGVIRSQPEDFQVDEVTLVEPDGVGEHCLLQVEKRNSNTEWVAALLARHAGVPRRDVSYAGMKDRNAVTRQWFSVRLAGLPEPGWRDLDSPELKVLRAVRHSRKLRPGALRGNRFQLRVRQLEGDMEGLNRILGDLSKQGMPNFYGEQRFGREAGNLLQARALFEGSRRRVSHHKRGLYLSAARSLLFNRVLAHRVAAGNWNRPLPGERLMLDGSRNSFLPEQIDDRIRERFDSMDVHTSGPLWGRGDADTYDEVALLERKALEGMESWQGGLEQSGMERGRRALRARIKDLNWFVDGDCLELDFFLPKGSFATVLLRECIDYRLPAVE